MESFSQPEDELQQLQVEVHAHSHQVYLNMGSLGGSWSRSKNMLEIRWKNWQIFHCYWKACRNKAGVRIYSSNFRWTMNIFYSLSKILFFSDSSFPSLDSGFEPDLLNLDVEGLNCIRVQRSRWTIEQKIHSTKISMVYSLKKKPSGSGWTSGWDM